MPSHYEKEKQDDPIETLQSPPSSFQMKGFPMIAGTSPAKDGNMTRMSNPPQYRKHYHDGAKVTHTSGWTTDASAQHVPNPNKKDKDGK